MKKMLLTLCCLFVAASPASAQNARQGDDRPKISVAGEATVFATPDKIVIQFGVETQDKSMLVAKQKNNDIVAKVFAAIKASGVKDRDIQTQYLYAEPRWAESAPVQQQYQAPPPLAPSAEQDSKERRRFLGYFVKNTIAVTVKDAAKIDKVIADVLAAGATNIYGVGFESSELKTHREKARELALKAAREKAMKMAAVLDQTIGPPIEITESGSWSSDPFSAGMGINDCYNAQVSVASPAIRAAETTTIALGKLSIRATVQVTFELKR